MPPESTTSTSTPKSNRVGAESIADYITSKLGIATSDSLKNLIQIQIQSLELQKKTELSLFKLANAKEVAVGSSSKPSAEGVAVNENKETAAVAPKTELAEKIEAKPVLLAGFTEEGFKSFKEKMPEILAKSFEGLLKKASSGAKKTGDTKESGGFSLLDGLLTGLKVIAGGGILIVAGLAALVKGLMDDGPFKGLMTILSKGGIMGGIKLIETGAKMFTASLIKLVKSPLGLLRWVGGKILKVVNTFRKFGTSIKDLFSGSIGKIASMLPKGGLLDTILKPFKSIFKVFAGPLARKIPVIGALISFASAISRFKNGDWILGLLDIASGLTNFLYLTGIGTAPAIAIGIGIDALTAFLDYKGGTGEEKKTGTQVVLEYFKGMGKRIAENADKLPVIGPVIRAVGFFKKKEWVRGLKNLAMIVPLVEGVLGFLGDEDAKQTESGKFAVAAVNYFSRFGKWASEKIQNLPIIGSIIRGVKLLFTNPLEAFKIMAEGGLSILGGIVNFFKDDDAPKENNLETGKSFISSIYNWIRSKLIDLPVIGGMIKGLEKWFSDPMGALQIMADNGFSMLGRIVNFFKGDDQPKENNLETGKGFVSSIVNWMREKISNIPYLGAMMKGLKNFLTSPLEGLKIMAANGMTMFNNVVSFFSDTEVPGADGETVVKKGFISRISEWVTEKINNFPVIGGLIKGLKFWFTNPAQALQIMANNGLSMLGSIVNFFKGDDEPKEESIEAGKGFISSIYNWFKEKIYKLPIIGSLIEGLKLWVSDPIKALTILRDKGFSMVGSIVNFFTDTEAQEDAVPSERGFISSFYEWAKTKLENLPIIGGLIKGLRIFAKDPIGAMKEMAANGLGLFKNIVNFFSNEEKPKEEDITPPKSFTQTLMDLFKDKLKKVWENLNWAVRKGLTAILPDGLLKTLGIVDTKEEEKKDAAPSKMAQAATNVSQAASNVSEFREAYKERTGDEKRDLAVQQIQAQLDSKNPKVRERALKDIDAKEKELNYKFKRPSEASVVPAIVPETIKDTIENGPSVAPAADAAAPITIAPATIGAGNPASLAALTPAKQSQANASSAPVVSIAQQSSAPKEQSVKLGGNAEGALFAIANNTGGANQNLKGLIGGFNALAKALEEKLGIQAPIVAPAANNGPTAAEYAHRGNSEISSFRSTMETARPRGF